jgi:hypothetical protein
MPAFYLGSYVRVSDRAEPRYGGEMIGPARFAHIETCAREACRDFKIKDEMDDTLRALRTLDADLAKQRATLATLTEAAKPCPATEAPTETATARLNPNAPAHSEGLGITANTDGSPEEPLLGKRKRPTADAPDYAGLLVSKDVKKARRLVTARENAIKSVKALIKRKTDETILEPVDALAANVHKAPDDTTSESSTLTYAN